MAQHLYGCGSGRGFPLGALIGSRRVRLIPAHPHLVEAGGAAGSAARGSARGPAGRRAGGHAQAVHLDGEGVYLSRHAVGHGRRGRLPGLSVPSFLARISTFLFPNIGAVAGLPGPGALEGRVRRVRFVRFLIGSHARKHCVRDIGSTMWKKREWSRVIPGVLCIHCNFFNVHDWLPVRHYRSVSRRSGPAWGGRGGPAGSAYSGRSRSTPLSRASAVHHRSSGLGQSLKVKP